MPEPLALNLDEIVAHLTERGRLEFDLAVERARNARLEALLAESDADAESEDEEPG